jgi:DNA repair protein RadA/Sms
MTNPKTIFACSKCDAQFPKWAGRCSECGAWGTVAETVSTGTKTSKPSTNFDLKNLTDFKEVSTESFDRIKLGLPEIEQIFGGGVVKGSLTLLGGEPGIGKSTLALQILKQMEGSSKGPLLYISGEESASQIKLRMDRLDYNSQNLKFLAETNVEQVCAAISTLKPELAIIDSIQTVHSAEVESEAGNVSQIRACTSKLLEVAKTTNTAVLITGHVTKDGAVAGPKTLEHLVDVVMYLEGDKFHEYRLLRCSKNRFGSTNEVAVLEMGPKGLLEISDPSQIFLAEKQINTPGSVISCYLEGTRPFMIEVQALVTPTIFGYPQRKVSGYDLNRLQMIAAVLFKRAGLNLQNQDIHLNIVGGLKVNEPALDLAVAMAIFSALKNVPIANDTIALGELGLGGEIRTVQHLEKRLQTAEKLGFKFAFVPSAKFTPKNIKLKQISNIKDLSNLL